MIIVELNMRMAKSVVMVFIGSPYIIVDEIL